MRHQGRERTILRRVGFSLFLTGGLLLIAAVLFLFWPLNTSSLVATPGAVTVSYDEAVAAWNRAIAETPASVRENSRPIVFLHGKPTERVFVFLHGLSNTPEQFRALGQLLYERGHNVVIQRMPFHGEKNRLATEWGQLTARQMLDSGNEAVDMSRGLGKHLTVSGLSVNGSVVAWMAQNRSDIERAVIMAPFLQPMGFPIWTQTAVARLLLTMPNFFVWWDPRLRENIPGPDYAYPRFPTRIIGQVLFLSADVIRQSKSSAPKCGSILLLTTASDIVINNGVATDLARNWEQHRPGSVLLREFPASDKVPHDFIDPNQTNQRTDFVYPQLIRLLEQ